MAPFGVPPAVVFSRHSLTALTDQVPADLVHEDALVWPSAPALPGIAMRPLRVRARTYEEIPEEAI